MAAATEGQSCLSGVRVLVVEDEALVALALHHLLDDCGCHVLGPVPTVRDALLLLDREQPDVALLDVNLRGELVTPVAERLKSAGVPVVLVTGCAATDLPTTELRQTPLVLKPVDEAALMVSLAAVLQR